MDSLFLLRRKAEAMAVEESNAKMTQIEYDLFQAGVKYGPDGELVQVDTPWAMGCTDRQGVPLRVPMI